MNFFGHYYFDKIENNPIHTFGLLTPDLLRNFTPNDFNKKLLHRPNNHEIWQIGISKHFLRDKSFHNSKFFKLTYSECHDTIRTTFKKCENRRFWFALHVIIEMILDKVLIQKSNRLLNEFYLELSESIEYIPALLLQINHQEVDTFMKRMNRFIESQYLYKYLENEGIVYGLNRIFNQVGADKSDWTQTQFNELTKLVAYIELRVEKNLKLLNS